MQAAGKDPGSLRSVSLRHILCVVKYKESQFTYLQIQRQRLCAVRFRGSCRESFPSSSLPPRELCYAFHRKVFVCKTAQLILICPI